MTSWPFSDPQNVATITVKQIVQEDHPVLLVVHAEEDGGWQFLTGGPFTTADALMVSLRNMVQIDSNLSVLADLPVGWEASRVSKEHPWVRSKSSLSHDQ